VGIELPSKKRKTVSFREIVARDEFLQSRSLLTLGLGKDIGGGTVINDLARMPHLLVAGTTGSGKSVFVNTVICSILFKATPDQVRFLMIDPKRLELFPYDGIPHLLHPVVVNPKKAAVALQWAVEEMERRYRILAEKGTRDIVQYNKKIEREREAWKAGSLEVEPPALMPYIVVVIDELADLMMIAARDVEQFIARLAQMARASGIHLLIATQRPSVDILTGVIKANFPSRISFKVSSKVDSRTILDTMGAEKLLGMGDMLFIPPGTSRLQRIHGAFISEREITRVTEFIKKQAQPSYDETILAARAEESPVEDEEDYDELYDKAVALVTETRAASISNLQRRMRIGYNRAARMIERMEREGVVGQSDGVKPREVLVNKL
jgi:S-DNA-T family DNA segregation ATPase FtsK/SpoIIIE